MCALSPSALIPIENFKGLYTIVLEKKRAFLRFFSGKTTQFKKKLNVYLFLHVIRSFMNFFKRKYL